MATGTFYSINPGDGALYSHHAVWATVRAAATATVPPDPDVNYLTSQLYAGPDYYIWRGWLLFNTASIPAGSTINSGTLKVWNTAGTYAPTIHVVLGSQMATDMLYAEDFDALGSTSGGSVPFNRAGDWSTITLNASGLGFVVPNGFTKMALRDSRDLNNTAPTEADTYAAWNCGHQLNPPELYLDWTPPATNIKTINGLAKASIKTVNGLAIASMKTYNGLAKAA